MEELKKEKRMETLDEETIQMTKRLIVTRASTKHINLRMRQLEMKRKEVGELAGLLGFDDVKNEVERAKSLEKWAKRCTHHFTKKEKRMLFEEIDNMIWSGCESAITGWCKRNKVCDEIMDDEIQEIWDNEDPEDGKPVRLNGKYVW